MSQMTIVDTREEIPTPLLVEQVRQSTLFATTVATIMEETNRPETEAIVGLLFIRDMTALARAGARCGTRGTPPPHL